MSTAIDERENPGADSLRRVCLIDYRHAGPGPRATDAIAVQASLRLADSLEIQSGLRQSGDSLRDEHLAKAVRAAAARTVAESRLIGEMGLGGDPVDGGTPHWEQMDAEIARALWVNFKDISIVEYLTTALPYALRYLGLGVDAVTRVRFLAWVSALLRALDQATSEQIIVSGES